MLKGSSSTPSSSHRRRGGGGEAITPSRSEGLAGADTASSSPRIRNRSTSATYDVTAWASRRPSRVVVSSAAGLIITVTDGAGEVIKREAGCATGLGPVAHDGVVDHSARLRRPQASVVLI